MTAKRIPFDGDGNLIFDTGYRTDHDWRTNETFEASLRFHSFEKVSQSVRIFIFLTDEDKRVCVRADDMSDIIPRMVEGVVEGRFRYRNGNPYYSVYLVTEGA